MMNLAAIAKIVMFLGVLAIFLFVGLLVQKFRQKVKRGIMNNQRRSEIGQALLRNARRLRQHATYFDWDNKTSKELHICEYLAAYLKRVEGLEFADLLPGDDPPDCILKTDSANFGVEVRELVDRYAIEDQIRNRRAYSLDREWNSAELEAFLTKCIADKDIANSKFDRYILLVHTDEPGLRVDAFDEFYKSVSIPKANHLDEVYMLFGYDPQIDKCPVRRLV